MKSRRVTGVVCFGVAAIAPASAQSISGFALDDSSRAPLAAIVVRLLDQDDRPVRETRTDSSGFYAVTAPAQGVYRLLFRRSEGGAFVSRRITVPKDSTIERSIAVPLLPAVLRTGLFVDEVSKPAMFRAGSFASPHYPSGPRTHGQRGMTIAFVVVNPDGKPDLRTLHLISTSPEFASAVRDAIRATRFVPAERDGQASSQVVQLSYAFGFGAEPLDGDVTVHATEP